MAGIYVHIPYCRQACHYCNFHFSTRLENTNAMISAILREAELRRSEIEAGALQSLYLGGGTPSVLPPDELKRLLEGLFALYEFDSDAEITLEANPDDLSAERLSALKLTPLNRLSIGIQSFHNRDLHWMNRAHDAEQARQCLKLAAEAGFDQLSADLIYGIPGQSDEAWRANIRELCSYGVSHLSAYALTLEHGTALAHSVRKGAEAPPDDEQAERQFRILLEEAERAGLEHYEISNFCLHGAYARHNSSYWNAQSYLGLGPSAHSFNGVKRSWNIQHNIKYVTFLERGELPIESEVLSAAEQLNERIMTGLRSTWGLDFRAVEQDFGPQVIDQLRSSALPWLQRELLLEREQHWFLSKAGRVFADRVASDLFLVDEEAQALQSSMEREGRLSAEERQAPRQPSAEPLRERRRWWSSVP